MALFTIHFLLLKYGIGCLSGLFGKSREGYHSVSRERRNRLRLNEKSIVESVRQLRSEAPDIGANKLFLILKGIFPDAVPGRDRFYDIIRRNHLMLKPERRRHTTNSNHNYRKYKNLAKGFSPVRPDSLWVADITFVETDSGVVYLHIVTNAWAHEIVGWEVSETLHAEHTIKALKAAMDNALASDLSGLMHHSDRGSQYCCNAYVELLRSVGVSVSITDDYKPSDNAVAERGNGIIKQECLYSLKRPKDTQEAWKLIDGVAGFYNTKRTHMVNDMMAPAQ